MATAVLDQMTGSLCDALTGSDDGSAMLEELERSNLFVVPLDDQRTWYRYHHLFADALRARLLGEHPGRALALHGTASQWYADHGSERGQRRYLDLTARGVVALAPASWQLLAMGCESLAVPLPAVLDH
jgi:hypothetical protein